MRYNRVFVGIVFLFLSIPVVAQVPITFKVHMLSNTPAGDSIFLVEKYVRIVPMIKDSPVDWHVNLDLSPGYTLNYIYCRNHIWFGADELLAGGWDVTRQFQTADYSTIVYDTVKKWKWWPVDGKVQTIDQSKYLKNPPDSMPNREFQSGVFLPDWWDTTFIYNVNETLDSIVVRGNANFVEFAPIPEITRFYPSPLIDREGNNSISEEHLNRVLKAIGDRNLGLYLHPFTWSVNVSDSSAGYHSNDWWKAYEAQWRPMMLYYAQKAEDYHARVLVFSMWPSVWWIGQQETPIIDSLAIPLLEDVRKIYHGKIAVEFNPFGPDLQLYSKGDYLHFVIADFWPWKLGNTKTPTVDSMFIKMNEGLDELYRQSYVKWGKKVVIGSLAASSYDGTVINQPDWESQLYYYPDDTAVAIDVQEQADAYEAMIHSLSLRDWIVGAYSFNYNYWNSYDKAPSVRNKPAEKVMAKWWRWLNPDRVHLMLDKIGSGAVQPLQGAMVLPRDTLIELRARADKGFAFVRWEGDVSSENETKNPLPMVMNSDKDVRAVFENTTEVEEKHDDTSDVLRVFPNPARNQVSIVFVVNKLSFVRLWVNSPDGHRVATLLEAHKPAGVYRLRLNLPGSSLNQLANGVYQVVFQTDTERYVKKLLVSN
jgi:hypothetical protein